MTRPIIYIAHPLASDWEANIASARVYAERLARAGFAPVAPYLTLYGLLHEPADRALGLEIDEAVIMRADALLVCGTRISHGMEVDMNIAFTWGIPVVEIASADEIETLMDQIRPTLQMRRP